MNKEIKLLDTQIIFSVFSIISFIISILLTENERKKLLNECPLFENITTNNITKFNRLFVVIIAIVFLIINYQLYNINTSKVDNLKPYKLQLTASSLIVIAAFISLYVVFSSNDGKIYDIENPGI
ncbi:MAG: hypothetical protein RR847_03245 [Bacilli bacterium]